MIDIGKDLNNLLNNAIALQKKQRRRTVLVVILIAIVGAILFFYSNLFTAKTVKAEIQKDSTVSNPIYKSVVKRQNDNLKSVIEDYFDARQSRNLDVVSAFYADTTFDFFYSYPNQFQKNILSLTKKEVMKIEKIDFRNPENRGFEYVEFLSSSQVSDCKNDTTCDLIVFVKGKQFHKDKMYDSILEIKLKAKTYKICSIRPYIDTFRKMN
jgi:hypothetical protein